MKKYLLLITLPLLFFVASSAQERRAISRPTPSPESDVVKISTNLIQVDVTVTDKNGVAVRDLRPEEIEIYENGERQVVKNFSFVSSSRTAASKPALADPAAVPPPPVTLKREQVRRTIALVIDDLSLSFDSVYYTRRALKKFIDEQMQDGDLVAIIRTGAGMGALQQFTSDKRMLYAAIERVRWNPAGSGGIGAFAPIEIDEDIAAGTPGEAQETETVDPGRGLDEFRETVFATGTLGALRYVIGGMEELPGRKSVILFSHGFRLLATDSNSFQTGSDVLDFVKALVDTAMRSSVVFYAIDPRGLAVTSLTAADRVTVADPERINQALAARSRTLSETQDGLRYLTHETGGFAFLNNNDLSAGVRRVLDDQSYYLVGYEPDSDTFDAAKRKFNRLEIKVLRPGASVRYRSGFFNVADRPVATASAISASPSAVGRELAQALVSPFGVNGVGLTLTALFGTDAVKGDFVRSILHVKGSDMKFSEVENGGKKVMFDVLAMSFGDNGQMIDQLSKSYTLTVKPEAFRRIHERGFVYHFLFPVKKPGAYQYRVALRDSQVGTIGSASQFIDVPELKKKRLTLSSVVIENLSVADWRKVSGSGGDVVIDSDPLADTALRIVRQNSVLRYGYEIYNAKLDDAKQPRITTQIRVFREGKVILDGAKKPFEVVGQKDFVHLKTTGAIAIGEQMEAGEYILQIIVTDELAKKKQQIATQVVQFEVVQ